MRKRKKHQRDLIIDGHFHLGGVHFAHAFKHGRLVRVDIETRDYANNPDVIVIASGDIVHHVGVGNHVKRKPGTRALTPRRRVAIATETELRK